jgi:hypothetical protein
MRIGTAENTTSPSDAAAWPCSRPKPGWGLKQPLSLLLPIALFGPALRAPRCADFTVGFDGVPEVIAGSPGEAVSFDAYVTLTTSNADHGEGAQGWVLVLRVDGGKIRAVSDDELEVSTIFDPDEDPSTPPIDPYDFPLSKSGFAKSIAYPIATEDGTVASGAIIETVLGVAMRVELQPGGTQRIARLTIEARMPADGKCAPLLLQVLEKDTPIAVRTIEPEPHSVFGVPFHTAVLYRWEYVPPTRESTRTQACEPTFRRGDANDDARVDISDAIATLAFLFLDRGEPACLDAADSNDDGRADVSDVIFTLDDLFGPYAVSRIPAPGPSACGLDPTSDELGCGLLASCSPQ